MPIFMWMLQCRTTRNRAVLLSCSVLSDLSIRRWNRKTSGASFARHSASAVVGLRTIPEACALINRICVFGFHHKLWHVKLSGRLTAQWLLLPFLFWGIRRSAGHGLPAPNSGQGSDRMRRVMWVRTRQAVAFLVYVFHETVRFAKSFKQLCCGPFFNLSEAAVHAVFATIWGMKIHVLIYPQSKLFHSVTRMAIPGARWNLRKRWLLEGRAICMPMTSTWPRLISQRVLSQVLAGWIVWVMAGSMVDPVHSAVGENTHHTTRLPGNLAWKSFVDSGENANVHDNSRGLLACFNQLLDKVRSFLQECKVTSLDARAWSIAVVPRLVAANQKDNS